MILISTNIINLISTDINTQVFIHTIVSIFSAIIITIIFKGLMINRFILVFIFSLFSCFHRVYGKQLLYYRRCK